MIYRMGGSYSKNVLIMVIYDASASGIWIRIVPTTTAATSIASFSSWQQMYFKCTNPQARLYKIITPVVEH